MNCIAIRFVPPEALREESGFDGGDTFTVRSFEYDDAGIKVNRRTKETSDEAHLLPVDATFDVWSLGVIAHMLVVQG
jgi:hypothetical protein